MAGEIVFNSLLEISQHIYLIRSGRLGYRACRKNVRRAIQRYLNYTRFPGEIWCESMCLPPGMPTIKDILKLAHIVPQGTKFAALFGYFVGKPHADLFLPINLKEYIRTRDNLKANRLVDRLVLMHKM